MAKYESQQWAEMGLGFKQYHKGRAWVLNNTTKTKLCGANYEPTSQLWAKKNKMGNFGLFWWATLASFVGILGLFFFFFFLFLFLFLFFFFFFGVKNQIQECIHSSA
jgi:hypothetical protein